MVQFASIEIQRAIQRFFRHALECPSHGPRRAYWLDFVMSSGIEQSLTFWIELASCDSFFYVVNVSTHLTVEGKNMLPCMCVVWRSSPSKPWRSSPNAHKREIYIYIDNIYIYISITQDLGALSPWALKPIRGEFRHNREAWAMHFSTQTQRS